MCLLMAIFPELNRTWLTHTLSLEAEDMNWPIEGTRGSIAVNLTVRLVFQREQAADGARGEENIDGRLQGR